MTIPRESHPSNRSILFTIFILSFLIILLSLGLIWLINDANTATVYIDPSCTNTGDGSTTSCASSPGGAGPFKTWGEVSWASGNSYFQKKGTTARELVTVGASGADSSHIITLGAYGTGAAPIITGSNLVTTWVDNGGSVANTWKATVTTEPKIVIFNGTRGTKVGSVAGCNADKKWYWVSNSLYTYGTVKSQHDLSKSDRGSFCGSWNSIEW